MMFLKNHIGIPGVLATVALVFAMLGGAYAATSSSTHVIITKLNQIKASVRNQLKGQEGPQGPIGPAGANGKDGASGKGGKSVVTTALAPSEGGCTEGGTEFEVAESGSSEVVCNGEKGPLLETLPSEKALKGLWGARGIQITGHSNWPGSATISFPFPVSPAPTLGVFLSGLPPTFEALMTLTPGGTHALIIAEVGNLAQEEEINAICPGTPAAPKANPGYLCVYTGQAEHAGIDFSALEAGKFNPTEFGENLPVNSTNETESYIKGTWAVTAE